MRILLYCATFATIARSAVSQEYAVTTPEASVDIGASNINPKPSRQQHEESATESDIIQYEKQRKRNNSIYSDNSDNLAITSAVATTATNILISITTSSGGSNTTFNAIPSSSHYSSLPIPPPSKIYHRPPPLRIVRRIPTTPLPQPYFDPSSPTNISAQLGMHAFLPCTIRNLNNNSISWIRSRDSHILTVDRYTFIADERFQAWHEEQTETWTLQVKYVQERDAGRYECQISTEPKMSHFVLFHVVTPLVQIPGGPDIYVKSGSTVTLKCIISAALILPEYIFWYQGTERVLSEEQSGVRQVFVDKISDDTTIGTLVISTASPRDQGTYTCVPASLPTATVTLHVLNAGEHPAAMHHGGGPLNSCPPPFSLLLLCLWTEWLLGQRLSPNYFIITLLVGFLPR